MIIIIGDPHGCLTELRALVQQVGYVRERDSLIIVGDTVDRGPNSVGVVEYCIEIGARLCRGNHEDNALRFLAHEARVRSEPGYVNPMEHPPQPRQPPPVDPSDRQAAHKARRGVRKAFIPPKPIPEAYKAAWRALSEEHLAWMRRSAATIALAPNWVVVHAGVEARPMAEQLPDRMMRIRYINPTTGHMTTNPDGSLAQPPGSVWWMDAWSGPENIVYGHAIHSLEHPRIDVRETPHGIVRCYGIDTGCCFGGRLTAMVCDNEMRSEPRFVQVQAERAYMEMPTGGVAS